MFVPSDSSDALDFDAPDHDPNSGFYSTGFANVMLGEDSLVFSGGVQSSGSRNYSYRLDVPDGMDRSFTIRQIPKPIPAPTTATLGILGLLSCLCCTTQARFGPQYQQQ